MDQVEEVKNKVDLIEVISSYVPLKKMGRNMGGLCPFHGEKTPSFMISPERQAWKCFGCGEGGDVFTFLEKIEGWDFKETLEELAKRAGVKLVKQGPTEGGRVREKLLAINALAEKFYSHILDKHPAGETGRKYLEKRGIEPTLWQKFGLGYVPDKWDSILTFLTKRGYSFGEVATSGLIIGREQGARNTSYYDRFRGRIMFPLKDARGAILGFSGRVVGESREAKYINSPETPIYIKGNLLFGLDVARSAIREKNEAVLVEGEFDVLSAHYAGVLNVVATKGTALTDKQVAILSRLCENVVLCFDQDLAGDAAARRGIELLDIAGVNVKVVEIKGAKDPDEFAKSDPKGFKDAISHASNIYDYFIDSAIERNGDKTAEAKRKIGREVLPVISKISDDLMRAHYVGKLAERLELETSMIADAVSKKRNDIEVTSITPVSSSTKAVLSHEEYLLALFLAGDELLVSVIGELDPSDFESSDSRAFFKWLRAIIGDSKLFRKRDLIAKIPEKFSTFVDHLYLVNISPAVLERELWAQELLKVAARIKRHSIARQLLAISAELKEAQKQGDLAKIGKLSIKFDTLSKSIVKEES